MTTPLPEDAEWDQSESSSHPPPQPTQFVEEPVQLFTTAEQEKPKKSKIKNYRREYYTKKEQPSKVRRQKKQRPQQTDGNGKILRMRDVSYVERIELTLQNIKDLNADFLIGNGDINQILDHKGDKQDIKNMLQIVFYLFKDVLVNKMRAMMKVVEVEGDFEMYYMHLDIDINIPFENNGINYWKQRTVEKTIFADNYFEACFHGYLTTFREVSYQFLCNPIGSVLPLSQLMEQFTNYLDGMQIEVDLNANKVPIKTRLTNDLKTNKTKVKEDKLTSKTFKHDVQEQEEVSKVKESEDTYKFNDLLKKYCI